MQDLEYLIQTLRCGGCNPLEGIDCYALKCTKHHYLQELVCFITTYPSFCMS